MAKSIPRRHAIPILYTRGTHYDVGFDMGRTFASIINNFVDIFEPLNKEYLPLYETPKGKEAYDQTLDTVKKSFPQYIRELEGIADGAKVEFHKLFLLHMDEILPQSLKNENSVQAAPVGCSTIIVNHEDCRILAHTEDALTETLNNYYFVVAHIINDTPQGKYNVKEEKFMSLCYAGHLPGYTMNYNHHGLVFSINTISATYLRSGKTPRHILTRSLLSSDSYEQALTILKDSGIGAADACSINLTFLKNNDAKMCYNIEMGPVDGDGTESQLDIREIPIGDHSFHCNKYLRLQVPEVNPYMVDSSDSRMKAFKSYEIPKTKEDVKNMLGDTSGGEHCVFRDNGDVNELVKTIAVGVFDLEAKTYELYSDNPRYNEPHVVIPLVIKED
ncbi:beta-alanyl-dopamine/carcinine hydrolase [Condylostylus longicornis]|uniref:beta-alanyl-dopamine/carcinine hydrolase n=1 Tax=Condylostylus longicornis TaxID=2530218 RepID=UPI00244DDF32|nr:beta-alanyl-dopamine/carcinine hydrolase [Condylostylus longicornis]